METQTVAIIDLPTMEDFIDEPQSFMPMNTQEEYDACTRKMEDMAYCCAAFVEFCITLLKAQKMEDPFHIAVAAIERQSRSVVDRSEKRSCFFNMVNGQYEKNPTWIRLGEDLHALGGLGLMQAVHYRARQRLANNPPSSGDMRELEYVWNGIGEWMS